MMYRLRQLGNVGSWMSLTNGFQSPNGITAMFIATEQDVANVAESSARGGGPPGRSSVLHHRPGPPANAHCRLTTTPSSSPWVAVNTPSGHLR
jgi:hypothetical protein